MVNPGCLGGGNYLGITGVGTTIANILNDGAVEKPGILQDHCKHSAQVAAGEIPDVVAIHQDGAAFYVVETHQQFDHGGFSSSGRANKGNLLAGPGDGREIFDDDFVRSVTELNVLELHGALHGLWLDGIFSFRHFLVFIQEFKHPLGRRGSLLEYIGDIGNLRDRLRKRAYVLDKCLDIADGDSILDSQPTAKDGYPHVTKVSDKHHDRHHYSGQELR